MPLLHLVRDAGPIDPGQQSRIALTANRAVPSAEER